MINAEYSGFVSAKFAIFNGLRGRRKRCLCDMTDSLRHLTQFFEAFKKNAGDQPVSGHNQAKNKF